MEEGKREMSAIKGLADKYGRGQARDVRDKGSRGQKWKRASERCPRQRVSRTNMEESKREISAIKGLADKYGREQARVVRDKGSRGQICKRTSERCPR